MGFPLADDRAKPRQVVRLEVSKLSSDVLDMLPFGTGAILNCVIPLTLRSQRLKYNRPQLLYPQWVHTLLLQHENKAARLTPPTPKHPSDP